MAQRARVVVPSALEQVEGLLADVGSWPRFLGGLDSVVQGAHDRYAFRVRLGRHFYQVPVVVTVRRDEHRMTWRSLDGIAWNGELRLAGLDAQHTRVDLSVHVVPRSFSGHVAEMLGVGDSVGRAGLDLQRLEAVLASERGRPRVAVPAARTPQRVATPAMARAGRAMVSG